jgi:hypothetical protein
LKSLITKSAVIGGREQMAPWSEMRGDDSVHLDEALRMVARLEPAHSPVALRVG